MPELEKVYFEDKVGKDRIQATLYLYGDIEAAEEYTEVLHHLSKLNRHDRLVIRFNSTGGYIDSAVAFRAVLNSLDCRKHFCLDGECSSSASMIFMCGDTFQVSPNSTMLIHPYTYSPGDKKSYDHVLQSKFVKEHSRELIRNCYMGFLNWAEMNRVIKGEEKFMGQVEIMERLVALSEWRE